MNNVNDTAFRRGSQIFSIFGQIEAVVAEAMIGEGKGKRIDVGHFPDIAMCPDIYINEVGEIARFAVLLPTQHVREFEDRIAKLRM